MNLSNKKSLATLKGLATEGERAAWFAGGRATVGKLWTVQANSCVVRYVAMVRGIVIKCADTDKWIYQTLPEAMEAANRFLERCKERSTKESSR